MGIPKKRKKRRGPAKKFLGGDALCFLTAKNFTSFGVKTLYKFKV